MDIAAELKNCIFNQLCGGLLALKDAWNKKKNILFSSFVYSVGLQDT